MPFLNIDLQRAPMLKKYAAIPFAVMCLTSQLALAEETKTLSSVVITATKTEQDSFDLPMSIDKVSKEQIQDGQLRMTLSESLARVPGITAQNRTQMAQDPQISSRGFGARSAFGVRGIRVYVDGIPLSMPDGIGNPGSVDLGMMDSIEVMRGPFSAMYGNSSGGVIQMFTRQIPKTPEVSGDVLFGSFGTRRESVQATGTRQGVDYLLNFSNFESDGVP
jgi:iron complex outermembrane receptor protein